MSVLLYLFRRLDGRMENSMKLTVRRACAKDSEVVSDLLYQVAAIHHDGRPDIFKPAAKKYTKEEFEELICMKDFAVLVAEDNKGDICGYAFCKVKSLETSVVQPYKTLYVDDFCVDIKYRGKKVGTYLFAAVKNLSEELGCSSIELNVWEFNDSAVKFYEKMGMKTQRRCMEYKI